MQKPLEFLRKRVRELLDAFKEDFPDYEIEQVVADLELKLPKLAKGSLKVTMKKKDI